MNMSIAMQDADATLQQAYAFLDDHREQWDLSADCEMEYANHVLRAAIQSRTLASFCPDLPVRLTLCQRNDGGWGERRDGTKSEARASAFSVQMLIRTMRGYPAYRVDESIARGLRYMLATQNGDGSWADSSWHRFDATSTSVGTLLFARSETALGSAPLLAALERGIAFVLSVRDTDGLWRFKPHGSPVEISAHLLPKCVSYRGWHSEDRRTIEGLLALQDADGSWDRGNTDHTCDAVRAMWMAVGQSHDKQLLRAVDAASARTIDWLMTAAAQADGGLGDRPGAAPHSERTADLIDTLLKHRQFKSDARELLHFWN
jgi:hypothetical protein